MNPNARPTLFAKSRCLLLILALPLAVLAQERQKLDEIVALVDEDVILRSELEDTIDNITQTLAARGDRLPPRSVMEEQVLERLVMKRLEIQRAQATGIRVSDSEVDQALSDVASQNNLTLSQLRQAIEADGFDYNEFREDVREELLSSKLRQRIIDSMDEVTATEVDILMASERFGGGEYHLSQILIGLPESASPAQVREAQERAREIHQQLREGMDFGSAAITYSQSPDALEGGDVGWRNVNAMPRVFAEAIENLQPGEFTDPIRAGGGLIILKVNDRRARGDVIVNEYRARHLMIEESELVSPEDARRRIHELHERLEAGEDFGELARRWSDDESSANIGGQLAWFPQGAFGPQIQSVIDNLEPGQLSRPFQTVGAWHILKLEDARQTDRTQESLRAEAREMISRQRADEEVERFLRQMRGEAFVEVRLQGTSGNL